MTFMKTVRPKGSYPEPKFNPDSEIFNLGFVVGETRSTPLSGDGKKSTAPDPAYAPPEKDPMAPAMQQAEAFLDQLAKDRGLDR